jgi:hypothetical protein
MVPENKTTGVEAKRKHCPHCDKDRLFTDFCKGETKEGLASWCKACTLTTVKKWQRAHPNYLREWTAKNPERARLNWRKGYEKRTPEFSLFHWAKHRAKVGGLPFSLSLSDIIIPKVCPVLGIKLERGKGKCHPGSPTLDKLIPERGYVPGNVSVISLKANNIKSDGTIVELEAVLSWLKGRLSQ